MKKSFGIIDVRLNESLRDQSLSISVGWSSIGSVTLESSRAFEYDLTKANKFASSIQHLISDSISDRNEEIKKIFNAYPSLRL